MDGRNTENDENYEGVLLKPTMPEQEKTSEPNDVGFFCRKRYLVNFLTALGLGLSYTAMVTLNVSIIQMTVDRNYTMNNVTFIKKAEFNFSPVEKISIMSFYNYGMLLAPLLGVFVRKVGGSTYFGYCNGVSAILTLISPAVLRFNKEAFLFVRLMQGTIAQSVIASIPEISIQWAPPEERSQFSAYSLSGSCFGICLAYSLSGITANLFGWESVFYVTGAFPLLWTVIWFLLVSETPAKDRFITETERHYLIVKNKRYSSREKTSYPLKKMFSSVAIYAYCFSRFSEGWGVSFINQFITVFVTDINGHLNIQSASFLSGGLQLGAAIALIIGSYIADYLRSRKILSIAAVHNIFMCGSQFMVGLSFIAISFSSNFTVYCTGILMARLFFSLCYVAYGALLVDVAGQYASLMSTIGLLFSGISQGFNPLAINIIVPSHNQSEWQKYFLFLAASNIASCIVFKCFGSSKLQPWALPTKNKMEETNHQLMTEAHSKSTKIQIGISRS